MAQQQSKIQTARPHNTLRPQSFGWIICVVLGSADIVAYHNKWKYMKTLGSLLYMVDVIMKTNPFS